MCAPTCSGDGVGAKRRWPASIDSAVGERRRALGHERGDAFGEVVRRAERALHVGLEAERGGEVELLRRVERLRASRRGPASAATRVAAAIASTSAGNAASSTHFQIRPSRAASSAPSLSPSIASPSACARPTSRGSSQVPPQSGTRPIFENAWMKLAERAATTMSQQQREVRAGAGGDAVDRGDDRHRHRADAQRERLVEALDRRADVDGWRAARGCGATAGSARSWPAQKPRPVPVTTTQRTVAVGGGGVERRAQLAVHRAR